MESSSPTAEHIAVARSELLQHGPLPATWRVTVSWSRGSPLSDEANRQKAVEGDNPRVTSKKTASEDKTSYPDHPLSGWTLDAPPWLGYEHFQTRDQLLEVCGDSSA